MQEKTINFNVIKAIAKVSEKLKDSKLKIKKSEEFTESVEKLNEYFGITEQQTWMLCAIISYCFDDDEDNCTLRDLARFFDCSVTSIMVYQDDFIALLNKHYIINNTGLNKHNIGTNNHFEVNADLMNCIMGNKPVSVKYEDCILTIYDFSDTSDNVLRLIVYSEKEEEARFCLSFKTQKSIFLIWIL